MNQQEIIDIFCHWMPESYYRKMKQLSSSKLTMFERAKRIEVMGNIEKRCELMDQFPGYRQIPSLVSPPLSSLVGPSKSPDLAKLANDAAAGIVSKYAKRFPGFVASVPMNNPLAMVKEAERSVLKLGASGVQIFTNVNGEPIDKEEFRPFYELMAELKAPIWLHPARGMDHPDYITEKFSKYEIWWALGWLTETSVAMLRLAYASVFDQWPGLKFITHHAGAFIPVAEGRLESGMKGMGNRTPEDKKHLVKTNLKESLTTTLKKFYTDTASFGSKLAIVHAIAFFGIHKMMFASDMPFGFKQGRDNIVNTIRLIENIDLKDNDKRKIFSENAKNILKRI
jgi:aminocarboxymuconate-semialdehyde decarboxylase